MDTDALPHRVIFPTSERVTSNGDSAEPTVRGPQPARSRKWAILALAVFPVLASAVAWGVAQARPTIRAARVELIYRLDTAIPNDILRQDRRLATQLVTIESRGVLAPIADRQGLTYEELNDDVQASLIGDSEVIRIQVEGRDNARNQALASEITDAYLAVANSLPLSANEEYLRGQIAQVTADEAVIETRLIEIDRQREQAAAAAIALATPNGPETPAPPLEDVSSRRAAEGASLLARSQALVARRSELQQQIDRLRLDAQGGPVARTITKPYALTDPIAPRPGFAALAGAVGGLMLAIAAIAMASALLRRRTDRGLGR